jgi:hypothetical protein
MITGLFYLLSIIAVLTVIWWWMGVAKSKDPGQAIHKGLLGVVESPKPKERKKRKVPPWQVSQIRRDDAG